MPAAIMAGIIQKDLHADMVVASRAGSTVSLSIENMRPNDWKKGSVSSGRVVLIAVSRAV